MDPAIETRSLSLTYRGGAGVRDVDLRVERGEIFGFLGPNGAGKTTTIRMLLDLLRPDRGEARLFGVEARAGGRELRRRVGYLPGDLALFGALTGRATLDLFAALNGRPPVRREECLERLAFPGHALDRKVKTYSTGMRQMLGLTLALQHEPELLILDEATTGLDPLARDSVLSLLRDCRGRGQTVFLSSHVLAEVDRCADRVAIIHRGRLHAAGGVEELKRAAPRVVTLRFRDGRAESFESALPPAALVAEVARRASGAAAGAGAGDGLVDVEIRSLGLDQIFRRIVKEVGKEVGKDAGP